MPINIALYRWNETDKKTKLRIMRRSEADITDIREIIAPIIEDVRLHGDKALVKYAAKFDHATINMDSIKASDAEFEKAVKNIDPKIKDVIDACTENVRKFHQEQMDRIDKCWMMEIQTGVYAGEQVTPIEKIGLYVPRGKGAFPSTMYMLCTPAKIARCREIAVVTPPTPDGNIDDVYLYTAQKCGVNTVYKAGGAQAIAALAYGTKTIPKVYKVSGPGSPYVGAAKRMLSDILDSGMPASSSEAIILADSSSDPHNTALDILNEAEHGSDSAGLLVTWEDDFAKEVAKILPKIIEELPDPHQQYCMDVMKCYGGIIITQTREEAIAFCNEYAPEHLLVKVAQPLDILPKLTNAGEILIGEYTPSTFGNFGIGINHTLPTGGHAKSYSCTGVWDFLKRTSISMMTRQGFDDLKDPVLKIADYENFPAHANAIRKRNLDVGVDVPSVEDVLKISLSL